MRLIAFAKFSLLLLGFNANALAFFFDGSPPGVPNQAYAPPAKRPFISLAQYTQPGRPTAAADRFKRQVDGAVEVTKSLGPRATYDDLISALYADHYGYSAVDSVIMFRLTGNADYIDQAIHMVDLFVTSENAAIAVGSVPRIAADSYLDVGRYLSELSLTYDYGYERLSVQQRSAWRGLAEQTLYNIWNYSIASWGGKSRPWSGWSTNDPGNNYYYSFLHATQLWALAGQNRTWLNQLQSKNHRDLVSFFSQLNGGGSREGTGYGTSLGSLFENYAYWRDSSGEDLSAYSDHTRQTIDYWIFATVPTLQFFAPIGDQARSSMPVMFDYQRKLMLEAVALNPGTAQAGRGVWWLNRAQVTDGGDGWQTGSMHYAFNFRYDLLAIGKAEVAPTALTYDATGTGALFARSDWSKSASWMHLMASHPSLDQRILALTILR